MARCVEISNQFDDTRRREFALIALILDEYELVKLPQIDTGDWHGQIRNASDARTKHAIDVHRE